MFPAAVNSILFPYIARAQPAPVPGNMAAPLHPEWALVRCLQRNATEPLYTDNWRVPGAIGTQTDRARCLFCSAVYTAKVEYVRAHVGGISKPLSPCPPLAAPPLGVVGIRVVRPRRRAAAAACVEPARGSFRRFRL